MFPRFISQRNTKLLYQWSLKIFLLCIATMYIVACGDSSDDERFGYIKFYNASSNAPEIFANLTYGDEEEIYGMVEYGEATSTSSVLTGTYSMNLEWQEDAEDYSTINEQDISLKSDMVTFVVVAGDFYAPDILTFEFENEDEELYDEDDEDNFSLRIINTSQSSDGIDVYVSGEDETFNEAQFVGTVYYGEISANNYLEIDSYKIYLTEAGSDVVLLETKEIDFYSNINYVVSAIDETGPGNSRYAVDILTTSNSVSTYSDLNSEAELRVYNGIRQHELISEYADSVDLTVSGLELTQNIDNLGKGEMSDTYPIPASDYTLDIMASSDDSILAENHFVSLDSSSDISVFLYLNEVITEDSDGVEQTEVYINTLPVNNSNRISLYDHQINIINLIQDDRFSSVKVYFVKSNQTVLNADYSATTTLATPRTLTIPNNSYTINLISTVDDSDLLLHFQPITLTTDDGDYFLILENDDTAATGFTATLVPQDE